MFTTGSKLFLGGTVLALVATVVYGVTTGGWLGTVALASVTAAFAFLAGLNFYLSDGNVPAMQPGATTDCAAAQQPVGRSMWPLAAAAGAALLAVGAETKPIVFKIGVVLVLAAGVEWMVQGWSERASADTAYNARVRKRLANPLEFPVLAAAGLGLVIYSFSRIMLWIDKEGGPVIFVVLGALVLTGGFLFASRPSLKRGLVTGVCAIGALGLISTGAVMAIDGQRTIHEYPTTSADPAVCNEEGKAPGEAAEVDHKASQTVAIKANLAVTVSLRDGKLTATELGLNGDRTVVTLQRSNPTNIMFRNFDEPERRFTVRQGAFTTTANGITSTAKPVVCTQLVEDGGEQMLTVKFDKPSFASEETYVIEVPGVEGQQIEIVVP
jgi:hypothetical protein